ncbi:30S ribosomal protein S21, partial [Dysosmobacter welbionis]
GKGGRVHHRGRHCRGCGQGCGEPGAGGPVCRRPGGAVGRLRHSGLSARAGDAGPVPGRPYR